MRRMQLAGAVPPLAPRDELTLTWTSRYVHSFWRGWESIGLGGPKQSIPGQLVHSVGLEYLFRADRGTFSTALEMQNLSDERTYDFFGVQRPGRALFVKTTAEL